MQKELTQDDLQTILSSYSEITEKLKKSHDVLQLEVRRLREELASKNRQLERRKRLAALGEMAAGLAHEIRNPLGGIQLYAGMLKKDLVERADLVGMVDKIIGGVKMLDGLVTNVLAMTHTVELKASSADIVMLINAVVELMQPAHISIQGPASLRLVCDSNMIQRAIMNLLKNAIEAAGADGQVFVDVFEKDNFAVVQISDTGPGIDEKIADKIFNPFFTTKDTGTGLGLAIVHRIIEAHEGTIRVTKSKVGGALFTMKIPLAFSARDCFASLAMTDKKSGGMASSSKPCSNKAKKDMASKTMPCHPSIFVPIKEYAK